MRHLLLALLPVLLGSCALLGTLPGLGAAPSAPPPATSPAPATSTALTAQAEAAATGEGVTVALTLRSGEGRPVTVRLSYTQQVNWGRCGPPPYVALSAANGIPVPTPPFNGSPACLDLKLTRLLDPGQTLTLRRTLPSPPPGTYTLTAWFDGEVGGEPVRVQALPVVLEVK